MFGKNINPKNKGDSVRVEFRNIKNNLGQILF